MIVTINTDASFSDKHRMGAYAYWIVYDNVRIKKAAMLKSCEASHEAEIKAIANAFAKLVDLKLSGVTLIIVNTDCLSAINLINGNSTTKNVGSLEAAEAVRRYIDVLAAHNGIKAEGYVVVRHVKAHTKKRGQHLDKRSFVNDWCDMAAKSVIRKHLETLKRA